MIKKSLMQFGDKDFGSEAQPFDFGCNEKGEHAFALDGVELTKEKIEEIGKGGGGGVQPTTEPWKIYGTDKDGRSASYSAYSFSDYIDGGLNNTKSLEYYLPLAINGSYYIPIVMEDFTNTRGQTAVYGFAYNTFEVRYYLKNTYNPDKLGELIENQMIFHFPDLSDKSWSADYTVVLPKEEFAQLLGFVEEENSTENGELVCVQQGDNSDGQVRKWYEYSGVKVKDIITQSKLEKAMAKLGYSWDEDSQDWIVTPE